MYTYTDTYTRVGVVILREKISRKRRVIFFRLRLRFREKWVWITVGWPYTNRKLRGARLLLSLARCAVRAFDSLNRETMRMLIKLCLTMLYKIIKIYGCAMANKNDQNDEKCGNKTQEFNIRKEDNIDVKRIYKARYKRYLEFYENINFTCTFFATVLPPT